MFIFGTIVLDLDVVVVIVVVETLVVLLVALYVVLIECAADVNLAPLLVVFGFGVIIIVVVGIISVVV